MEKMTFVKAMNHYIGKRADQNLSDFAQDIRSLSPTDKDWYIAEFAKIGVEITS